MGGFLERHWPLDHRSPRLRREVSFRLIHECEEALAWLSMVRSGEPDYETAHVQHHDEMSAICTKAQNAIDILLECDRLSAYYIRSAFAAGLCSTVPPK